MLGNWIAYRAFSSTGRTQNAENGLLNDAMSCDYEEHYATMLSSVDKSSMVISLVWALDKSVCIGFTTRAMKIHLSNVARL